MIRISFLKYGFQCPNIFIFLIVWFIRCYSCLINSVLSKAFPAKWTLFSDTVEFPFVFLLYPRRSALHSHQTLFPRKLRLGSNNVTSPGLQELKYVDNINQI